jgi:hypothetical protein
MAIRLALIAITTGRPGTDHLLTGLSRASSYATDILDTSRSIQKNDGIDAREWTMRLSAPASLPR